MTKAAPTFYVFHGDDDLRIDEEVAKMRARMGDESTAAMNSADFDGTAASVGDVIGAVSVYPFLSDKRLVIVKGMLRWLTRKGAGATGKAALEALLTELPRLPDWARLVFVEADELPEKDKVLALARSHERGLEKLYKVPKDPTNWIVRRAAEQYGATIEPLAASALAGVINGDLRRADNELVKLVSYVGEPLRPITEADVALLTPYVAEATMFDMVDALAEGRGKAAATLVHRLLEQEEDPFSLYGMIVRQYRLLLMAKDHLATGGIPKTISETLGVHPYVAEKLAKQTRLFTLMQLEKVYRTLQEYDEKMKTGRIEPLLALDLLIAWLSAQRR